MKTRRYAGDIYPSRFLYALILRSPFAKGRLVSIECPKLSGGNTLVTAADIPGINQLENTCQPILADNRLSYIGEAVALLLGPELAKLNNYAEQCRVIAEEEAPEFSANKDGAAELFAERNISKGNTDEVFKQAKDIIRRTYRTGIQEHWYAEPTGAIVTFDSKTGSHAGKKEEAGAALLVHTATQWPAHVSLSIARMLKLAPSQIKVDPTITGLHMDGKLWFSSLLACHAALGAWITKKPVRLMLTKEEDFRYSPKRNEAEIYINTALDEKDDILGNEINVSLNLGSYGIYASEILEQSTLGSLGVYRCDNIKLSGKAVKTNIPPQGPFSGFGLAQGLFAIESHVSYLADLSNKNPAQWRKEHCIQYNSLHPGLLIKEVPPIERLIDTSAAMSDYNRKWASYELIRQARKKKGWAVETGENLRGIGIALGWQGSGFIYPYAEKSNCGIELTLEKDGELEIKTGANIQDSEFPKIWAGLASEILAIDAARVRINTADGAPDTGPACASRFITILTKLMEQCCMDIRKQRFRDPLPITVYRGLKPPKNKQWEECLAPAGSGAFDASGFTNPGWAAAVVEIEIEPIEYIPKIRGVWLSVDGGKILLEDSARRSLNISSIQALGWAMYEQLCYTDGMISAEAFSRYDIPGPADIPPVKINFLKSDSEASKGIGELPFNCIPAAFLQAVSQAMDFHFHSIPLEVQDIWNAVNEKRSASP